MSILLIAVVGTLCCFLCSGTWSSIPRRQERLSSQERSRCVSGSAMHNPQDGFSLYSSFSCRRSLLEPWLELTAHHSTYVAIRMEKAGMHRSTRPGIAFEPELTVGDEDKTFSDMWTTKELSQLFYSSLVSQHLWWNDDGGKEVTVATAGLWLGPFWLLGKRMLNMRMSVHRGDSGGSSVRCFRWSWRSQMHTCAQTMRSVISLV